MEAVLLKALLYVVLALPLVGAYALLGLGITVIYQASRVLNLAHGAIAMGAAYTTYELNRDQLLLPRAAAEQFSRYHLILPLAVAGGIAAGALLGLLIEQVLVKHLRAAGPTTQTVGTVAALTFAIALAARKWGTLPVTAPNIFPKGVIGIGDGFVQWGRFGIFPVALLGAGLLFALFQFTDLGLAMRGAAQNRRGAALRGVDPERTAALAWVIGGAFAGLAGILLAGASELDPYSVSLGVLPAFVAALIGGLESMPGVVAGAAVIGLVEGMVPALALIPRVGVAFQGQGSPALVLGVVALVVMALRGARLVTSDVRADL
jgi:branched-chain amino acid transport system permease protein